MNADAKMTQMGMTCPECRGTLIHKYGHWRKRITGTKTVIEVQKYRCYACLRQFVSKGSLSDLT